MAARSPVRFLLQLSSFARVSLEGLWGWSTSLGLVFAVLAGVAPAALAQTQIGTSSALSVTSAGAVVTTLQVGTVLTLTATVSAAGTPVTPGQVNFCDASAAQCRDTHLLGSAQLTGAGTATLKLRPRIGNLTYKAVFVGTKKYAGSTSAASTLTVTGNIGQLASTSTIGKSGAWGTYTLSATVAESGNTVLPTGDVSFIDTSHGNAVLQTLPLGSGTPGIDWPNPQELTTNTDSQAVALGDFNGDGIPDIAAVAGGYFRPLLIYLGKADGTYTTAPSPAFSAFAFGPILVADFNSDGKQDMAVLNGDNGTVTIFLGNGDGTFNVVSPSPSTVSNPKQLAVGDFNGDGIPDLAATSNANNTLTILLGNGDGTFTALPNSPVLGKLPAYIAVADFNGDGNLDLALTDAYDDLVWILLGKGDGTFTSSQLHSGVSNSPLAIVDFNGDGKPDVALGFVSTGGTDSVVILAGNGDGTLTPLTAAPAATSGGISSLKMGDFNGDGIPDLVLTDTNTDAFTVFLNNGSASFTTLSKAVPLSVYPQLVSAVGDVNGDGRSDLVIGDGDNDTVGVYLTQPTQTLTSTTNLAISGVGQHLLAASYSGDGNYAPSVSASTTVWGQQPATATSLTITASGAPATTVSAGTVVTLTASVVSGGAPFTAGTVIFCDAVAPTCTDIHLLGTAPLSSTGNASLTFVPKPGTDTYKAEFVEDGYGLPSASAAATLNVGPAPNPTPAAATSIAGAGQPGDYSLTATVIGYGAGAPTGTISFLDTSFGNTVLGTATLGSATAGRGFVISQTPALAAQPAFELTGDFSGDGIPDLAVVTTNYTTNTQTVAMMLGKGDSTFIAGPVKQLALANITSAFAGDFNGDGKTDLVLLTTNIYHPDGTGSATTTLLGNGDGSFTSSQTSAIYLQPVTGGDVLPPSMAAADFNGDGKLDLAVVGDYVNNGGVTIALGNGDGTFQAVTPNSAVTQGFSAVATGDFNGDGVPDVVAANFLAPGGATILLGNGDGTLTALPATLPTSTFVKSIVVGEFNGDGKLDIGFASELGVQVFFGAGDGSFTQSSVGSTPGLTNSPNGLIAGDFNHDDKLDLATVDSYYGQVDVLLGAGDGTFTEVTATPTSPNLVAQYGISPVAADFNGDGMTDLAVINSYVTMATILTAVPTQTASATITGVAPVGAGEHDVDASFSGGNSYPNSTSATTSLFAGLTPLVITPVAGSYSAGQTLTIAESIPGATIYYELSGPVSTNGIVPYTGPVQLTSPGTEQLYTYATELGYQQTDYVNASFTITTPAAATPVFSVPPGTYYASQTVTITDATPGATIHYTTDGSQPTASSSVYASPLTVSASETLSAIAIASGDTASPVASAAYTISQPTAPAITWPTPAPIPYGTPLSATQLNATATVPGSFTYSPVAGVMLAVGQQVLKVTFTPANTTQYTTATATVTLNVTPAAPVLTAVTSALNPALAGNSITFSIGVTSTLGAPTGTVSFFDGPTNLGSAVLASGQASFTTSALTPGSHPITSVYSGDSTFSASTSGVLSQIVENYTIGTASGASATQTASPGGQASFLLAVSPPSVGTALSFSVTGLPAGATAAFSPSTIPAGSAPVNVTMTVSLPNTAHLGPTNLPSGQHEWPIWFGLLLFPFGGRLRKNRRRWLALLVTFLSVITAFGISGCGGSNSGGSGGSATPPQAYTLTVTASSGSLAQSTTVTLTRK